MRLTGKLFALLLPLSLGAASCSDECSDPADCAGGQVCYRGVCQAGLRSETRCSVDDECGPAPTGNTPRAFLCIAQRCTVNPAVIGDSGIIIVSPDATADAGDDGGSDGSAGPTDSGMTPVDTGVGPMDTGAGPEDTGAGLDADLADTGTSTAGDAGTSTTADAG